MIDLRRFRGPAIAALVLLAVFTAIDLGLRVTIGDRPGWMMTALETRPNVAARLISTPCVSKRVVAFSSRARVASATSRRTTP